MAAVVSENYQLKWHSFGAHLHSSVATSLNSDAFTDVSLFTVDGHQINAHRFVLATCSHYLQQIFKLQTKVTTSLPLIVIMPPEITYKTLKTLIQYMYCGETTVSNDILENVLRGGDILQVRGLWRPRNETPTPTPTNKPDKSNTLAKTPVKVVIQTKPGNVLKTVDSNVKTAESEKKQQKPNETTETETEESNVKNEKEESENKKNDSKKNESKQNKNQTDSDDDSTDKTKDDVNYIVIKEEPMEWNEFQEVEMNENEMFHTEMTIKPEIIFPTEDGDPDNEEIIYSPLTCELCSETYTLPAEWVRHIRTHTDMQPAKRRRGGRPLVEDDDNFPPLQCDLCQKQFPTPGEWVRHIQNTHTDTELAESNHGAGGAAAAHSKPRIIKPVGVTHKTCSICNKKFPSHASMLIHRRTHTGERPFVCDFCQKGFNVKSNLLRHLRTLHDKIINSADVNPDQAKSD